MVTVTEKINSSVGRRLIKIFGAVDENINAIKRKLQIEVVFQNRENYFSGEESNVKLAQMVVDKLSAFVFSGEALDVGRVNYICDCAIEGKLDEIDQLLNGVVTVTNRGKPVKCKTVGQKKYVDLINKKTITLPVGPAGTGRTYLAVALAVVAFRTKQVDKIISHARC